MPREVDPRADAQGGHPLSRAVPPMAPTVRGLPQALRASRVGGAGGPQLVSFAQQGQGVQSTPSSGNPNTGQGGGYGPSGWTNPASSFRNRWISSTMAVGPSGWLPVAPPPPPSSSPAPKPPPRVIGEPRTGPGSAQLECSWSRGWGEQYDVRSKHLHVLGFRPSGSSRRRPGHGARLRRRPGRGRRGGCVGANGVGRAPDGRATRPRSGEVGRRRRSIGDA